MARLILDPKGSPRAVELGDAALTIGAAERCELTLSEPGLAEAVARVVPKKGKFFLEDLADEGIELNGETTDYERLADGDTFIIGSLSILFDENDSFDLPAADDGEEATDAGSYEDTDPGSATPVGGTDAPVPRKEWGILAVAQGSKVIERVSLNQPQMMIGRDAKCDVTLPEAAVSGRHARISIDEQGKVTLEDLVSKNGTYLNKQKVSGATPLRHQDQFSIGSFELVFESRVAIDGDRDEGTDPDGNESTAAFTEATGGGDIGAKVIICSEKWYGKEFILNEGETSLGRDNDADIVLLDDSVSRLHALIQQEGDEYFVFDQDSANGVKVNGYPVSQKALNHGDRVELGSIRFLFVEGGKVYSLPAVDDIDEPEEEKPASNPLRTVLVALVAVAAIGSVAMYVMNTSGGGGTVANIPTPQTVRDTQPEILKRRIQEARDLQDWKTCIEKSQEYLQDDPEDPEVRHYMTTCQEEEVNLAIFNRGRNELAAENYDNAIEQFELVPDDSTYYTGAQSMLDETKQTASGRYAEQAEFLFEEGNCDEAIEYFGYALLYTPSDTGLIERKLRVEETCNKPTPKPVVNRGPNKRQQAGRALEDALSAYSSGSYQNALSALDEVVQYGLGDRDKSTSRAQTLRPHFRRVKTALDKAAVAKNSGNTASMYSEYTNAILAHRNTGLSAPVSGLAQETADYYGDRAASLFASGDTPQAYRMAVKALKIDSGQSSAKRVKRDMDKQIGDLMIQIRLSDENPPKQNRLCNQLLDYAPPEHEDYPKAKKILDRNIEVRGGLD